MHFYHNIGWRAPHLLKCHWYQLCRWWLQRGNNCCSFFSLPPPLQFHISFTRKRALCFQTGTDKNHYGAKKDLKAEWTNSNPCRKIVFSKIKNCTIPGGDPGWKQKNHSSWFAFFWFWCQLEFNSSYFHPPSFYHLIQQKLQRKRSQKACSNIKKAWLHNASNLYKIKKSHQVLDSCW